MTVIIDYGVGNLFSLAHSFIRIGEECEVSSDASKIAGADRIVLPGVGAFGDAMAKLGESGLIPVIKKAAGAGVPLLGICLGMQLLFKESFEYGRREGLGLLEGSVCPLADDLCGQGLKIPHMGWNALKFTGKGSPVLKETAEGSFVYFVHSFYAKGCGDSLDAYVEYGVKIPAAVSAGNLFGCQFHPEKSGEAGLGILKAFTRV